MTNTSYIKNAETKLSVTELHKHYGEHEVLKGVSLSANAGMLFPLLVHPVQGKVHFYAALTFWKNPVKDR